MRFPGASREESRVPEIGKDGAARHREGGEPGGRGKSGVSENVMVKDDLSRDRDGVKRQG